MMSSKKMLLRFQCMPKRPDQRAFEGGAIALRLCAELPDQE